MERNKIIIRTSIMGIGVNILLVLCKALIGLFSNSIAILLDALNNFSDVISSLITIMGTKLAGREADEEHPFGHGRYEYISAIIIAVLVMYAGITSIIESIKKILKPELPRYEWLSLWIILVAVITKILLSIYLKKVGKKINSNSLIMSGIDAKFDAFISVSTLVAALIFLYTGISTEPYLALLISILLMKSGYAMLTDTLSFILGKRVDTEKARRVRECILSVDGVEAVYDLVFNDYGPDSMLATAHIEVERELKAYEIDEMTRDIIDLVYQKEKIVMPAIGIYAKPSDDRESEKILDKIRRLIFKHTHILQIHGFTVNFEKKLIRFDIIVGFEEKNREKLYQEIKEEVEKACSGFEVQIMMDINHSDE